MDHSIPVSKVCSWVALSGEPARDSLPGFLPSGLSLPPGTVTDSSCFFGSDKVQALSYAQHTRQLISCGGDGGIVVWNMDVERQEVGSQKARATLPWPPGWALHLRLC